MDHTTTTSSVLRDLYEALEMLDARQRASWRMPSTVTGVALPVIDLRESAEDRPGPAPARVAADWVPGDPR